MPTKLYLLLKQRYPSVSLLIASKRILKSKSRVVAIIIVMALAVSSSLTLSSIDSLYNISKQNQARRLIGSDLAFRIPVGNLETTEAFITMLKEYPRIANISTILSYEAHFGEDATMDLIAMNPQEFSEVAYFPDGRHLANSPIMDSLNQLKNISKGIILSSDIGQSLDLNPQSELFLGVGNFDGTSISNVRVGFTVLNIYDTMTNPQDAFTQWIYSTIDASKLGRKVGWINSDYIYRIQNISRPSMTVLASLVDKMKTSELNELIESLSSIIPQVIYFSAQEKSNTLSDELEGHIRAGMSELTLFTSSLVMILCFALYFTMNFKKRTHEEAILFSLGANIKETLVSTIFEIFYILVVFSIALLLTSPLLLMIAMKSGIDNAWIYILISRDLNVSKVLFPIGIGLFVGIPISLLISYQAYRNSNELIRKSILMESLEDY